ncbi:MAG: hypothetical protein M3356_00725, partial [Actinomycetota bacterium]|nr:hypothetical protein [Actinomycetota bacterium]
VRERQEAGADPAATVTDAIEIGARVLDREQTGANADFVKSEFEKVSKEVEREFGDNAREVAEQLGKKVDEVFHPESGHLAKSLEELFSDGSSRAVQNRVKEMVGEAMQRSREDLLRQFSSGGDKNPLADFKTGTMELIKAADERQHRTQRALLAQMTELEKQLQGLRDEKQKLEQLDAERERGTAKGRTYEEQVVEALDSIAEAQGDCCDAVGDLPGASGRTGDAVIAIDAAAGPVRGRIVFEAKDRRLSAPRAREELSRALEQRDADFAVLVVPGEDEVPAKMRPLREWGGDSLIVTYDPEEGSRLALEVGYRLARARVLMARADDGEVDSEAVRTQVERALAEMVEVRKVKSQLTGAKTSIDNAYSIVEAIAARVRCHLQEIDSLVLSAVGEPSDVALDVSSASPATAMPAGPALAEQPGEQPTLGL